MEVYQFDKCLLDRLEESMNVLSWKNEMIPASQVRLEWSYFIELQIEPAGWQTLWNIPRVICEEMDLRFPTVVYGTVEQVLFKELKAIFLVEAVQEDDVHLPERHEVNLEDLWPTKVQENDALNVQKTADCIDRLRFFYAHVWMPWDRDNDDDLNWVEKHLESRIRLCYDLKKKNINRALAAHMLTLLAEAKYIQQRREYFEIGLSDDEELDDTLNKTEINDLMRLHLRLTMIKSEIEMLENPDLRKIYEDIKFNEDTIVKQSEWNSGDNLIGLKQNNIGFVVTLAFTIKQQVKFLQNASQYIPSEYRVQICPSLQNVLNICKGSDSIYLCPGKHTIKFLEYLTENGTMVGLTDKSAIKDSPEKPDSNDVIVMSPDDDSILMVFDGDYTLENIVLDCRNIRTGIMARNGKIFLKNCRIIGDGKSSTQRGIVCSRNGELLLEDCIIENFATGIILNQFSTLTLKKSNIIECKIGIDVNDQSSQINFNESKIIKSSKYGIYLDNTYLINTETKYLNLTSLNEMLQYTMKKTSWKGDCNFQDCTSNICILNKNLSLIDTTILNAICNKDTELEFTQECKADVSL